VLGPTDPGAVEGYVREGEEGGGLGWGAASGRGERVPGYMVG